MKNEEKMKNARDIWSLIVFSLDKRGKHDILKYLYMPV